ncbi:LOW QUALITY PROTEIN: RNA transcription, translation and transport factor protein-like [Mustela erminea]|uniref:LOW QUALITY PROTEIN: RNA transcription, translation and transport factor protein-like n=1 Tax=Mustela erminea TaxID=36723 RepID=UPI0013866DED|nr:LOW QUALITY PROTEIN: RNA transcription, translation and transport factor protein-like [Mustela erminea]
MHQQAEWLQPRSGIHDLEIKSQITWGRCLHRLLLLASPLPRRGDHLRRKLTALDHHNPAGFNCKDETEFRNFIVWLEDQKIRHYKIEDRGNLRNIHSSDWPKFFEKYLKDVNCPFKIQDQQEAIDWLLSLAVRLEYGDNAEKYKDLVPDNTKNADNAAKNVEPLINLDVNNPDFKAGVMALANLLQIQRHDDSLVMLKAIRILVQECLTQDAVAKANQTKEGLPVALDKHILGFDTGDAVPTEAAQILRLLHIEELRELQTKINEAIVAVQAIIADPKTKGESWKMNVLGFQFLTYLVQLGTMYALACVWKSNVTFSREES